MVSPDWHLPYLLCAILTILVHRRLISRTEYAEWSIDTYVLTAVIWPLFAIAMTAGWAMGAFDEDH